MICCFDRPPCLIAKKQRITEFKEIGRDIHFDIKTAYGHITFKKVVILNHQKQHTKSAPRESHDVTDVQMKTLPSGMNNNSEGKTMTGRKAVEIILAETLE